MDDELEEIRERKRKELLERANGADGEEDRDDAGAETPSEPIHVEGDGHFRELAGEYDVVLVDFYADWCGPCRMLSPILEEVAAEADAAVAKVDTDVHGSLASRFGVQGLPTLVVLVDGEPVDRLVGMQEKATLLQRLQRHAG